MTNQNAQPKIKEKVQKLLNQAADREGTPEGDSFYAKAFALMAEYGFEGRDLTAPSAGDEIVRKVVKFTGAYTDMQAKLFHAIARALHCTGFITSKRNSTAVPDATIFGLRRHVERVEMLFSMLMPVMMAGAKKVRPDFYGDSTVVLRRSFMAGFAASIERRLAEAETTVADTDGGYALVLVDDKAKAKNAQEDYLAEQGLTLGSRKSRSSFNLNAYSQGGEAGKVADLGQTRVGGRLALGC